MKVPIRTKLTGVYLVIVLTLTVTALYSLRVNKEIYIREVGRSSVLLAEEMFKRMDQRLCCLVDQMHIQAQSDLLQKKLALANAAFARLPDAERYLAQQDKDWVATAREQITPFMQGIIKNDIAAHLREIFIDFFKRQYGYSIVQEIIVTNKYGANVAVSAKTEDYYQADEKWWQKAREKGLFVDNIYYDDSTANYGVDLTIRIDDAQGKFIGILLLNLDIKKLIKESEVGILKYASTNVRIITSKGGLIYATKPSLLTDDIRSKQFFRRLPKEKGFFLNNAPEATLFSFNRSNGFKFFQGLNWGLLISHQLDDVLKPYWRLQRQYLTVIFFLVIIGGSIVWLLANSITTPLKAFAKVIAAVGKGQLSQRIIIKSKDEFGDMAAAFNTMITTREEAEAALRESENRFRELFENMSSGVAVYKVVGDGEDFIFKDMNIAGLRSTKNEKGCIVGKSVSECFPGVREFGLLEVFQKVWRHGKPLHHPVSVYRDEKLTAWFDNYVYKLPSGEIVAIFEDVSEVKRAEAALRGQQQFLETVIDSLPHPFYVIDVNDYSIVLANKTAREINNMNRPYCYAAIHGEDSPCSGKDHACPLTAIKNTGEPAVIEHLHRDRLGNRRYFAVYAYPLFDDSGQLTRMIEMSIEISERKAAELALQQLTDELEGIIEKRTRELRNAHKKLMKQERLATIGQVAGAIAHDLRNPLGVINNALYYLRTIFGEQNEKIREYFDIIKNETTRAVAIIEELLTFTSFPVVDPQETALDKLIDEVIARTMSPQDITITSEFPPNPPMMRVDREKMVRALRNIIDNGVQATGAGGQVIVRAVLQDKTIEIQVADSGHGIADEHIAMIFEPLFTTRPKGIGLGLSSAKQIIEAHGGTIEVTSVLNQGSVFTIKMPLESTVIPR